MSVHKGRFFQAYILFIAVVAVLNRSGERAMSFEVDAAPLPSPYTSSESGLEALTAPIVDGAVNPLTTGVGSGVAGEAAGTQQFADLTGDAAAELAHVVGEITANTEQGSGVAVANAAPPVQSTVQHIQNNDGAVGTIAKLVGG